MSGICEVTPLVNASYPLNSTEYPDAHPTLQDDSGSSTLPRTTQDDSGSPTLLQTRLGVSPIINQKRTRINSTCKKSLPRTWPTQGLTAGIPFCPRSLPREIPECRAKHPEKHQGCDHNKKKYRTENKKILCLRKFLQDIKQYEIGSMPDGTQLLYWELKKSNKLVPVFKKTFPGFGLATSNQTPGIKLYPQNGNNIPHS